MQDSLFKVIGVAAGVCLVCSVFVSTAAVALKPMQDANATLFKQQNILLAAGLIKQDEKKPTAAEAKKFFEDGSIESVVVDLETGEMISDAEADKINSRKEAKDPNPKLSRKLGKGKDEPKDTARIGRQEKRAVVYLTKKDGKVDRIVFPIYGKGLWSTMYGFISLNYPDLTVAKINFYEQAETAGLGGEIANPKWQEKWEGKQVFAESGKPEDGPKIAVVRNGKVSDSPEKAQFEVDGIAGSTLTSNGVSNTVQFWLGESGFGPYLKKLREQGTRTGE